MIALANNVRVPGTRIDFQWKPFPGTEGIDVTYRYCIWHADEVYALNRCVKVSGDTGYPSLALA